MDDLKNEVEAYKKRTGVSQPQPRLQLSNSITA